MNTKTPLLALCVALALSISAQADYPHSADWLFAPSAFTHNPVDGKRTAQYAQVAPVEPLDDPRQTVSRYWQTRTRLRGADGSSDTIYEVRSFGNTRGGFDAQRERGFDTSLSTLSALEPFRHNPYLFFGGLQGFGFGFPGYPGAVPGAPYGPGWTNPHAAHVPCDDPDCQIPHGAAAPQYSAPYYPGPYYPGAPGTAYPYAPQTNNTFIAPFYGFHGGWGRGGWGPGGGYGGHGGGHGGHGGGKGSGGK